MNQVYCLLIFLKQTLKVFAEILSRKNSGLCNNEFVIEQLYDGSDGGDGRLMPHYVFCSCDQLCWVIIWFTYNVYFLPFLCVIYLQVFGH